MNYHHIKVFYTVVKHQNISKAAEELEVTQPAISRIITTIEKENNIKLFSRSKSGVNLTAEGIMFYDMIKEPFSELEKIEEKFKYSLNFTKKTVKIGATAIALTVYLFQFIEYLKVKFPDVTFKIYTDSSNNIMKQVLNNEIDLAFVTTPIKSNFDIETFNVCELENVLVAPVSYRNKIKGAVSIQELSKYPFVLLNNEMQFREHLNEYFRKNNVKINVEYELDSSSILLPFVENDCGLTFIPKEMADIAVSEGRCINVDLLEKVPVRYVTFLFNRNSHHSSIVHAIRDEIISRTDK